MAIRIDDTFVISKAELYELHDRANAARREAHQRGTGVHQETAALEKYLDVFYRILFPEKK